MQYRGHPISCTLDETKQVIRCQSSIGGQHETFECDSMTEGMRRLEKLIDDYEDFKEVWKQAREKPSVPEAEDLPESIEIAETGLQYNWLTINEARKIAGLSPMITEKEAHEKLLSWAYWPVVAAFLIAWIAGFFTAAWITSFRVGIF